MQSIVGSEVWMRWPKLLNEFFIVHRIVLMMDCRCRSVRRLGYGS
jgi:hypothetical protein